MNRFLCIIIICLLTIGSMNVISTSNDNKNIEKMSQQNQNISLKSISIPITLIDYEISNSNEGDMITVSTFGRIIEPGKPQLPQKIISIAIPQNAIPTKVTCDILRSERLPGTYELNPASIPSFINDNLTKSYFLKEYQKNIKEIYEKNSFYPKQPITFKKQSKYRNYNLVDVQVTPFSYNPISDQIIFSSDLIINVEYKDNVEANNKKMKENNRIESIAKKIIVNYDQTEQWYLPNHQTQQALYNDVIITLDSLTNAIQPIVVWETEKGNHVKVVTIDWIDQEYQGYDLCEKIRNFLREKYPSDAWGIENVIIIGHWDDIPMRRTYQSLGMMDDENMPETDYYYAELSLPDAESWDADQDHRYGENSDQIDYYGEVSVGRIPWSDEETVYHICQKSVAYEQNTDPSFKNNILLLANLVDDNTDGATFMEYCVNADIHPWMEDWMKTRIYDRNSQYPKDYVINNLNVRSVWSSGTFGVVGWNSHGNPYGSGNFISIDDCHYLNDDYPSIVSAASCSNSDTNYLNIGQAMIKQGAVGFLGANKVAYYASEWDDPLDGSDQSFKYYFLSSITAGEKTQGQAVQFALSEMYQKNLWYNLKYETFVHSSLFGIPTISIASPYENNGPETPSKPNGPDSGKIRQVLQFSTVSTDPDNDQLYYGWSWEEDTIEWIGPYNSGEEITAEHIWTSEGTFEVKVKAKDIYGTESSWSESLSVAMPKNKCSLPFMLFLEKIIQRINKFD